MQTLVLVRHGQAEHHLLEITGGWTDTSLTEVGQQQAGLLASRLHDELDGRAMHLGASQLRRAAQTAVILEQVLGTPPVFYSGIADLNNGIAAGKTHNEARLLAQPYREPYWDWQPYPEAETWGEFFQRVVEFMDTFHPPDGDIPIFVTHAATIDVIINWWLQIPMQARTHFEIGPASISILTRSRWNERTLERLNDCAHLYAARLSSGFQID